MPDGGGGSGGYEHLLEVLADPKHEEHRELCDWIGGTFDPEAFDLEETDRLLRSSSRSHQLAWTLN